MGEKIQKYFRPEWTCGKYNKSKRAAIFYNLLEGMSYYFEDDSADVVGAILESPRNGEVSINRVGEITETFVECLEPFFEQLLQLNLLTKEIPNAEGINNYRISLSKWKKANNVIEQPITEKLPIETTNAEMAYANRVGGVTSIMFELTYNCSEKCIHCYNIGATRNDDEISHRDTIDNLSWDDYKKIIDDLHENGLVKVTLSGGDPFSNPFIWDIMDYLFEKSIVFDIYTNALALKSEEDALRLAQYYPRLVGISIYSSEASVHDYITRVPGSWERSVKVAQWLSDHAVPMNIKCCIMQPNLKTYRGVNKIAKNLGAVPQFEINVTDSVEGDRCVSRYLRLTAEQMEIVLRDDNIKLYVGPEAPNFGGQQKSMDNNACGAGEYSFCMSPTGELMPCCAFHFIIGNLKDSGIADLLFNEKHKQWLNSKLSDYEECGKYDYCAYCNLCPGLGYSEHGDWRKAAENCCYTAKIRYNLANKMKEGYDPISDESIDLILAKTDNYKPIKLKRI